MRYNPTMRILILSSLFPPDPGDTASYVKELAARFSSHEVTLLIYGHLPEVVPGVTIITISKRLSVISRLFSYTKTLYKLAATADMVIVNNAPATELPALFISFLMKKNFVLCLSDLEVFLQNHFWYTHVHHTFARRCRKVVTLPVDTALWKKIEWLPYQDTSAETEAKQANWWEKHITDLVENTQPYGNKF